MTPLEASTQVLLHFNGDYANAGVRKAGGLQTHSSEFVSLSSTARFGTHGLDLGPGAGSTYAGLKVVGAGNAISSMPFTMECWVYLRSALSESHYRPFMQIGNGNILMGHGSTGLLRGYYVDSNGTFSNVTSSAAIPLNTWTHIAFTFDADKTRRVFIGGNLEASSNTIPGNYVDYLGDLYLGSRGDSRDYAPDAVLDEVRFVSGYCLYTANFTPPVAPFPDPPAVGGASGFANLGVKSLGALIVTPKSVGPPLRVRDVYFGGTGKVVGDVALDDDPDVPVARKVWLIRTRDAVVIRETWSAPITGAYSFLNIDRTAKYAVLAFDHTGVFNAVVADNITPEAM